MDHRFLKCLSESNWVFAIVTQQHNRIRLPFYFSNKPLKSGNQSRDRAGLMSDSMWKNGLPVTPER